MGTQPDTIEFILEQVSNAGKVSARKMFGEYAIYCDGKVVALVCDDQLFIKPTQAGRAFINGTNLHEKPPYPGAKDCLLISGDLWEDRDWLGALIRHTADALPAKKPRKPG